MILTVANLVLQCIMTTKLAGLMKYSSPLYPGFGGCYAVLSNSNALLPKYSSWVVLEATALILMTISAFRSYRQGNFGEFSQVLHRDGIFFYVVLLCISIVNVVLPPSFASTVDRSSAFTALTPLEVVLYSVLTTRIMLNIRDESHRGVVQTELHTEYHQSLMVFAVPVRNKDEDTQGSAEWPRSSKECQSITGYDDASPT